jgi:small subunit ribosomal protein S6
MAKVIKATKKVKESKTKSVLTDEEKQSVSVANKYELMFILSPMLTEDKRKKALDELNELLTTKTASVFHVDDWGKRDLAYKIKKQSEGYYMIYYFNLAESKAIAEIDRHLRLDQAFLRHLILKREDNYEIKDFTIVPDEVPQRVRKYTKIRKEVPETVETLESDTDKEI